MTFDAPNPERTCARRIRSNTPLQALTLLNDEVYIEASKALAKHLKASQLSHQERIEDAWMRLVGKPPSKHAIQKIQHYLQNEMNAFKDSPDAALAITGEEEHTKDTDQLAAWILTCRAILNLDEVITKS
jgi:hypothetical protein